MAGFATSVLLGASPANALDFTFSFRDVNGSPAPTNGFVTGTLSGLVEGNNLGPGITATVTSSPGGDLLGTYNFGGTQTGTAFIVTGGNITFADAGFDNGNNAFLFLGTFGSIGFSNQLLDFSDGNPSYADPSRSTTQFAPATAVPFELNSTVGLATLGLCFGAAKLRRKHLAKKRMISVS
ncbi:MAG: hypothetical protein RLZZ507_603 [Cyanobacteriota bacterium]